jgi:hypothetical protein
MVHKATVVAGGRGAGDGFGCNCGKSTCGLLVVEYESIDPVLASTVSCGDTVMRLTVRWTRCVQLITPSGSLPDPGKVTASQLDLIAAGWKFARRVLTSPRREWRIIGMQPETDGDCEGIRIDVETDLSVCAFRDDEEWVIC